MMETPDRRRYFRINDWVGLHFRRYDESASTDMGFEGDNLQISAAEILKSIDQEFIASLDALWQNNPAAANTIGLLNRKVELLASELNLGLDDLNDMRSEAVNVNISACGIAFESEEQFRGGDLLDIHLTLRPALQRLRMQGQVVACERAGADRKKPFVLRVDFVNVPRDAKEQLIQHIVRRQSDQLAKQRRDS